MDLTSRRTFLKLAAMAAPSVTPLGSLSAWGMTPATLSGRQALPGGLAHLRKQSLRARRSALRGAAAPQPDHRVIQLDPGGSVTRSYWGLAPRSQMRPAICLTQMPASARGALLKECFGADGLWLVDRAHHHRLQ